MKKKLMMAAAGAVALLLQACGSTPLETQAEPAAIDTSMLNVYPDNTVAFTAQNNYRAKYRAWSTSKDEILALEFQGRIYNAKDISTVIFSRLEGKRVGSIAVQLRSGETFSSVIKPYPRPSNIAWLACNAEKVCTHRVPVNQYNKDKMDGIIVGVFDASLQSNDPVGVSMYMLAAEPIPVEDWVNNLWDKDNAPIKNEVIFLSDPDSEKAHLLAKVDSQQKLARQLEAKYRNQAYQNQEAERVAEEQAAAASLAKWSKGRVGAKDFCTTAFLNHAPSFSDAIVSDCQQHGRTTTGEFVKGGWVITSETARQVNQYGVLYAQYDFTIEKVR